MSNSKKTWKYSRKRTSPSIRFVGPRPVKRRRRRQNKHTFLTEQAKRFKRNPTASESIFESKLQSLGIEYESQWVVDYKGIAAIYDFYIPSVRLLIEIDGGYHTEEYQQQTDRIKDFIALQKLRRKMARLTNEQARAIDVLELIQLIYGVKGRRHRAWAS